MRVAHVTYVHDALDVRIFRKQCRTLADAGHDVHLIAPDPPGEVVDGIRFHELRRPGHRTPWGRLKDWRRQCIGHVRSVSPEVVHVHDPLLTAILPDARRHGVARLIYDVHEEHATHARRLTHMPPLRRELIARAYDKAERLARAVCDHFIVATPTIAGSFPAERTTIVRNLPILEEFEAIPPIDEAALSRRVAYIGGLTNPRGLSQMIEAVSAVRPPARLALAGRFDSGATEAAARRRPGWSCVDFEGFLGRGGIAALLAGSAAGLVVLQPNPGLEVSWPVKMFEYMAAARPVIASDFTLWREIIEGADCGIVVDPTNPQAITSALSRLLDDPTEARRLGDSGRQAIRERYSWDREATGLLSVYTALAGA